MKGVLGVLVAAVLLATPAAAAAQSGDAAQAPVTISQVIRQAGYTLSDAEAAYLDAEQQLQVEWVSPLYQVVTLAGAEEGTLPSESARASIAAELQKVLALDPAAGPQPPAQFQRLRELAISQRQALQRAARAWLNGLEAGDPAWRESGAEAAQAAQRDLEAWATEMAARFPPPQPAPTSSE